MKTIRILMAVMTLVVAGAISSAKAQTLTTLLSFCGGTNICVDGTNIGNLIKGSDGNFYAVAESGGTNDDGTVVKITPQGTLTSFYQFTNSIGFSADLSLESGGVFYGTTLGGGSNHVGTVFSLTPAGTFTTLHEFSGTNGVADGSAPLRMMAGPGSTFIGTTAGGGTNDAGTVFTITPAGTLTTIHQFSGTNGVADGTEPILTLANGANFIGSTFSGGTFNTGTVFQITPSGAVTTLHQFNGADGSQPFVTVKNGANFIGTTESGGSNGFGTAFSMTSAGTITTFYHFSGPSGVMDGSSPALLPIQDNAGAFYGGTSDGGTNGQGLVFTLSTAGVLTPIYQFCSVASCLDGVSPGAFAIGNDGNVYGTTGGGGSNDAGTFFKFTIGGGGGGVCSFELGSTSATPSAAGGNSTVSVIASNGCDWTAASNDGFITVTSGSSGSGNGTVHYSVAANSSTNPVTGTMTIAGITFTVNQAGAAAPGECTFTLNATDITLTSKGGKKSVSVKAVGTDCPWTAVSNDSFITITAGTNGTGNGKVSFTVPGNTNTTALVGTLTIAGQTFTVNQDAGGCTFKLSPKSAKFKSTGGVKTVKVSPNFSNCAWAAVSNSGFITITSGSTNWIGKGAVSYTIGTNSTTDILTNTMTIAGQTYTVIQSGVKPPKD